MHHLSQQIDELSAQVAEVFAALATKEEAVAKWERKWDGAITTLAEYRKTQDSLKVFIAAACFWLLCE